MKKKFDENPSNPYLSGIRPAPRPAAQPAQAGPTQNPPYKMKPVMIETRSRRLQLLVQPSLYDRLKKIADTQGTSLNELIHKALEELAGSN